MSLATVPWEGDDEAGDRRSLVRALTTDDAACAALSVSSTTARTGSLSAGVWEIVFENADPSLRVGVQIGGNAVTAAALPTTGNTSTHTWIGLASEKPRVRIKSTGTNTYIAIITSSATAVLAYFRRVGE